MDSRVFPPRRNWFGRRRVEDREVPAEAPVLLRAPELFPTTPSGSPIVSPTNALGVADVFACVRCLSDAAASVPLIPYRKTPEGRTRVDGKLSALLRRPAPATTTANLLGQAMAHAIAPRLDSPLIFPAPQGGVLNADNWRRREWSPAVEAAGILRPARIYDLRSTFASDALAAGVPIFTLARIMGTSVRMIERHYGALLDGAGAGIAEALDALDRGRDQATLQGSEGV